MDFFQHLIHRRKINFNRLWILESPSRISDFVCFYNTTINLYYAYWYYWTNAMVYCKSWLYWYLRTRLSFSLAQKTLLGLLLDFFSHLLITSPTIYTLELSLYLFHDINFYQAYTTYQCMYCNLYFNWLTCRNKWFYWWYKFLPGLYDVPMYCNLYFNWLTCRNKWFYWFISSFGS